MAQNNPDNLAKVEQVRTGISSFLEALDTLPADARVSVQLGVLLAADRGVSIEEAKTALRKFNQALSYFKADQVVAPTLQVVPVNALEDQLSAAVVAAYNKKMGIGNEAKAATPEVIDIKASSQSEAK